MNKEKHIIPSINLAGSRAFTSSSRMDELQFVSTGDTPFYPCASRTFTHFLLLLVQGFDVVSWVKYCTKHINMLQTQMRSRCFNFVEKNLILLMMPLRG